MNQLTKSLEENTAIGRGGILMDPMEYILPAFFDSQLGQQFALRFHHTMVESLVMYYILRGVW